MNEECGSCKFWRRRSDERGKRGGGFCVRFPPFAPAMWTELRSISSSEFHPSDQHLNDAWPMVGQQSWCGEYLSTPQPNVDEGDGK